MMNWYKESDSRTRRVFWTCGAGWALDTADGLVFQYLIPLLVAGLGITLAQAGTIASANYFAAAIGGWLGGWLCDRYGRARILRFTILWFSFFSFLSGFAQNFDQLLIIRILQGIGFGSEWAVGAVLLGELIAPQHRGKALGAVQSGAPIGSGIAALLAGPVAAALPIDLGWRVAFWFGILPAILIFFVRREGDDPEIFREAAKRAVEEGRRPAMTAIFSPKLIRLTMLTALLSLGAQGGAFAIGNYTTAFLTLERGLTPSMAGICVLLLSAGGFFGVLTNAYLGDRIGRRGTFRVFAGGFVMMVSLYLFAPLGSSLAALIPVGMIYGFFQFGIYASFGPYFTELFPTEVRGTGQAFAYNFGRATAALFIFGVGQLSAYLLLSVSMAIFAIFGMAMAVLATFFLPETAGRKLVSLHDLE